MREPVIVSGVRTPVGRYMGGLKEVQPFDLAALVLNEVVRRAGIQPDLVDDVIFGQSYQNGEYVNIARMALLKAGWPDSIPGVTLDRRCCTGLDTVRFAAAMVQAGYAELLPQHPRRGWRDRKLRLGQHAPSDVWPILRG